MSNNWTLTNLITVAGYECPKNTLPKTKKILRLLKKYGTVIFNYDDGPDVLVMQELKEIADYIGLTYYSHQHQFILIDENLTCIHNSNSKITKPTR